VQQPLVERGDATRCALAAVPVTSTMHRTVGPVNAGCTPSSREIAIQRRSGDAVFLDKPGVQPALTGAKRRWMVLVIKTAARAQRVARRYSPAPSIASACSHSSADCVGASLLVTLLWRDREKLPALAGRIPAALHRVERTTARPTHSEHLTPRSTATNPATPGSTPPTPATTARCPDACVAPRRPAPHAGRAAAAARPRRRP
jgi:hypothetical protein